MPAGPRARLRRQDADPSEADRCGQCGLCPDGKEIEWSRRIIAAHGEAAAAGKGVVLVDGRLIENLHVENARRLIALAGRNRSVLLRRVRVTPARASVDTSRHAV